MSLLATVIDRVRRRKTSAADWGIAATAGLPDRRAFLADQVRDTVVPRRVVLDGPAGRIAVEAANGRAYSATITPAGAPARRFGEGAEEDLGPDFAAAFDALLATGAFGLSFEAGITGAFDPDAGHDPAALLAGGAAVNPPDDTPSAPATPAAAPSLDRAGRFLAAATALAAGDAAPAPLPSGLAAHLRTFPPAGGRPVLCILTPEDPAEPALALAVDGGHGGAVGFSRSRLGSMLRAWADAAQGTE